MEPRFDVYSTDAEGRIGRMFKDISLDAAMIVSGMERDEFYYSIINKSWSGCSPAWTSFRPVVVVPRGQLLQLDQFAYLIELVG